MSNLVYRRYQPGDAHAVSQLFHTVYGDHYVQPDVYLPNMISQHNADGRWTSMLAVDGQRVLGHAALCNDTLADTTELALSVVHPCAQRQNLATNLSRELLIQAGSQGFNDVMIKQVTHHPYTQRMAQSIGFHSTGLLPDYVPSPFAEPLPETIVIGCYVAQGNSRALPDIQWPESCRRFMQRLSAVFGTSQAESPPLSIPLHIRQHHQRYAIAIHRLNERLLDQLSGLPGHWLISVKLVLSRHFSEDLHRLTGRGFTFTGLMPAPRDHGWFALFHRGVQPRNLNLQCPDMQQLHDDVQRNIGALDSARSAA